MNVQTHQSDATETQNQPQPAADDRRFESAAAEYARLDEATAAASQKKTADSDPAPATPGASPKEEKAAPANPEASAKAPGEAERESPTQEKGADEHAAPEAEKHQKKLNKLAYRARRERKARMEMEQENARLKAELAARTAPAQKPKPEDFATQDEYLDARDRYLRDELAAEASKANAPASPSAPGAIAQAVTELFEDGNEKYPDFRTRVGSQDVVITQPMMEAILDSDNGVDVAYYLAGNPEEAAKIAGMPDPRSQFRALARIEAALAAGTLTIAASPAASPGGNPQQPQQAPAQANPQDRKPAPPPPIDPTPPGGSSTDVDLKDDSIPYEQYRAKRLKQLRAAGRIL